MKSFFTKAASWLIDAWGYHHITVSTQGVILVARKFDGLHQPIVNLRHHACMRTMEVTFGIASQRQTVLQCRSCGVDVQIPPELTTVRQLRDFFRPFN
jgi:hypothetical protein